MSYSPAEDLIRRTELVAQSEVLAAVAADLRHLSERATPDDLLTVSIVMTALQVAAADLGSACQTWGEQAVEAEDPLLARKIAAVARTVRQLSVQAGEASADADAFASLDDAVAAT